MTLNSYMPVKLITGAGCVRGSAKELARLGSTCLIVTGKTSAKTCGAFQDVTDTLTRNGQIWLLFDEMIAQSHSRWIGNGSIAKCQGEFTADMADAILRRKFLKT